MDWYTASLPQIADNSKGKKPLEEPDTIKGHPAQEMFSLICADINFLVQIREKVIEDMSSFFHSFSLRSLKSMQSVSDLADKEEPMLAWAETDSLETAVKGRMYIVAKYREMLLQNFLEARHKNFVSGQPTTAIYLQVLEFLLAAHRNALETLLKQKREHQLEWERSCSAKLFEGTKVDHGAVIVISNTNTRSTCWIRRLLKTDGSWKVVEDSDRWIPMYRKTISCEKHQPSVADFAPICMFIEPVKYLDSRPLILVGTRNFCRAIVVKGTIVDLEVDPTEFVGFFRRHPDPIPIQFSLDSSSSCSSQPNPNSSSTSSSSESKMDFIVDIPHNEKTSGAQIPTADIPQIEQASVNQISLEQLQTNDNIYNLKTNLSSRIYDLEIAFAGANTRQEQVFRGLINNARQEVQLQKAALWLAMIEFRREVQTQLAVLPQDPNDLRTQTQEFKTLQADLNVFFQETWTGIDHVSSKLSEIVPYINRGGDAKKGESSRGPQPPPDDRSRPGYGGTRPTGGGSRSESQRKIGGS
ncbi:hypothetical protein F511_13754 [Dorcoceras hygrometricum]|uniref:Uncharacterized protein n=1 Tax=Dorcoceras hygrometricum TaxID=472368 RepID=A0A2Z7BQZ4_9LAMI|nr:hypothetical protein F511_13754 [Dorcoceras hygrometricum]